MGKRIFNLKPSYIPECFGGIYFIIGKESKIIRYIGMSRWDVHQRLRSYDFERMNCVVKILRVKDPDKIRWYERRWIQKYKPTWNKLIPPKAGRCCCLAATGLQLGFLKVTC